MLDYDNLKLRERTFLDFTDDPAILDEILGGHSQADKKRFLRGGIDDQCRVITFMEFADLCDDKKLAKAIELEFEEEYRAIFNE